MSEWSRVLEEAAKPDDSLPESIRTYEFIARRLRAIHMLLDNRQF
jgi:hypothetical protein